MMKYEPRIGLNLKLVSPSFRHHSRQVRYHSGSRSSASRQGDLKAFFFVPVIQHGQDSIGSVPDDSLNIDISQVKRFRSLLLAVFPAELMSVCSASITL